MSWILYFCFIDGNIFGNCSIKGEMRLPSLEECAKVSEAIKKASTIYVQIGCYPRDESK